jgi:hypothetical protein
MLTYGQMVFSLSSSSTVSMTTEMTHTLSLSLSVSIYIYVCVCVCVCVHIYIYIKAANVVHALLLQTSRISDRDQLKAPPPHLLQRLFLASLLPLMTYLITMDMKISHDNSGLRERSTLCELSLSIRGFEGYTWNSFRPLKGKLLN